MFDLSRLLLSLPDISTDPITLLKKVFEVQKLFFLNSFAKILKVLFG